MSVELEHMGLRERWLSGRRVHYCSLRFQRKLVCDTMCDQYQKGKEMHKVIPENSPRDAIADDVTTDGQGASCPSQCPVNVLSSD